MLHQRQLLLTAERMIDVANLIGPQVLLPSGVVNVYIDM